MSASVQRWRAIRVQWALVSQPAYRRCSSRLATPVLPDPWNGSTTRSSGSVNRRIMCWRMLTGFCVGWRPYRVSVGVGPSDWMKSCSGPLGWNVWWRRDGSRVMTTHCSQLGMSWMRMLTGMGLVLCQVPTVL